MQRKILQFLLCGACICTLLLMGSHPSTRKAGIVDWSAEPEPTLDSISQEPSMLMMGQHDVEWPKYEPGHSHMILSARGPEDKDTKTTTDLSVDEGNCLRSRTRKTLELDDISASHWWARVNPHETRKYYHLDVEIMPKPWKWRDGAGDYGSHTSIGGFFVVDDGRETGDPRKDSKPFNTGTGTVKLIPDKMDTVPRTDAHIWDTAQLGCIQIGPKSHVGLRVWHPISNRTYPSFCFDGMSAAERIRLITTNGESTREIRNLKRQLILSATQTSTAGPSMWPDPNPSCWMNDNHAAGGNSIVLNIMEAAAADLVALWQTWHITTGGWDDYNPWPLSDPWPNDPDPEPPIPDVPSDPKLRHAIGRIKGGGISFSHLRLITYQLYLNDPLPGDIFIRVWKDGVTCLCSGPNT